MQLNSKNTDLSYLIDASGGNQQFIKEMIQIFLKQTPSFINELHKLLEEDKLEDFRKIMHKLKPTITMMGIREGQDYVKEIEYRVKNKIELEQVSALLKKLKEVCDKSYIELKEEL